MSRSPTLSGVRPAVPPISTTSAPGGVDSMRSERNASPADSAGSATSVASSSAAAAKGLGQAGSERRIEAEQNVVFLGQVTGPVGAGLGVLVEKVDVDLGDALDVAHEVIRCGQAETVHVDALVNGVGIGEIARVGVVVQRRERPALVGNVVDAGEAAVPAVVAVWVGVEEAVPAIPQVLRVPVGLAAEVAREIEPHDALVGVAVAAGLAAIAERDAALLARRAEQAGAHRADLGADAAEHRLGVVVVEHLVGTEVTGTVDVEVVGDAVAVHQAQRQIERADAEIG